MTKRTEYWRERWLRYVEEDNDEPLSLDGYRAKLFWAKLLQMHIDHTSKTYKKKVANHRSRY